MVRSLLRFSPSLDNTGVDVTLYLGVTSFDEPDRCQHLFTGEMKSYDTITHMVLNNQINDAIVTFVKKYNEEKQYSMILLSQGDAENDGIISLSAPVLTADPSLDITDEVLAGLNEEYIASKK